MLFFGGQLAAFASNRVFRIPDLFRQRANFHHDFRQRYLRASQIDAGLVQTFAAIALPTIRGRFGRLNL